MQRETVFANARLVLRDELVHGSVRVKDGVILDVARGPVRSADLDLEGDYLLPGLVELHTDHFEKQLLPRSGVAWPPLSALLAHDAQLAAAGITTVLDAVAIGALEEKPERMEMLGAALSAIEEAQSAGALRAEHWVHLRCEVAHPDLPQLFAAHAHGERVRLVSLMDHTPGARQYADVAHFRDYVRKNHGRTDAEIDAFIVESKALSDRHAPVHRSAVAGETQRRGIVLASHDDGTRAHIEEAVALGVSIAEFPTTFEAAQAAHDEGLSTIMGAPNVMRGGSHSGNIAAVELARAGLLDALSSDYMPVSLIEAPFRLHREASISLPAAVAFVSANPASMIGFDDRGAIAPGLRADLVRVREMMNTPVVRAVWREGERVC